MSTDEEPKSRGWFLDTAIAYGPALLAVLLIRDFVFEPFQIPSGSMVPTLFIGDTVFATKFSYGVWLHFPFPKRLDWRSIELLDLSDPERGDIIVFRFPEDPSLNFIKRVVGIPGDKIRVQGNQVVLNGELLTRTPVQRYHHVDDRCLALQTPHGTEDLNGLVHDVLTDDRPGMLANRPEIEVPAGQVFVMGDNRDNSMDSRQWGFVREDQIKGKAHIVLFSWDGCGSRFRLDRMGHDLYEPLPAPN